MIVLLPLSFQNSNTLYRKISEFEHWIVALAGHPFTGG